MYREFSDIQTNNRFSDKTKKTHMAHNRAVLVGAAIEAGLRAWRAGEDIDRVLTLGGYTRTVIEAVKNYIIQDPENAEREEEALPSLDYSSQSQDMSSSTAAVKRRRIVPVSKNVKKYVKGCMDKINEIKYVQGGGGAAAAIAVAGTFYSFGLFGVTQGDTDSTRDGNIIHTKKLWLTYNVNAPAAFGYNRVIVFWDKQANGANPAVTDVLATATYNAPFNETNVVGYGGSRFTIVMDHMFTVSCNEVAAGSFNGGKLFRKKFSKSVSRPITYQGNAGTIADIAQNNLLMLVIGTSVTQTFAYQSLIQYVDN